MFDFGFKGKVKSILKEDFQYIPNAIQAPVFSGIVSQAKSMGVNEYDAAIMFMITMMNSLYGQDEKCKEFVSKHSHTIERIMHSASSPNHDINEMIDLVKSNNGIT